MQVTDTPTLRLLHSCSKCSPWCELFWGNDAWTFLWYHLFD